MNKRLVGIGASILAAALFLVGIYLVRPINETALIRQTEGTSFFLPYLGRTTVIQTGHTMRQFFTSRKAGSISSIGVFTPEPNHEFRGTVTFKLARLERKREIVLYSHTTNIESLANNEGLSYWRFAPVKARAGDRFVFSLKPKADPGFMVFVANRDAYKGGATYMDSEKRGVDIAFQVFYALSAGEWWRHLYKDAPNLVGPTVLSAMLFFLWLSLAFWMRELWLTQTALNNKTSSGESQ